MLKLIITLICATTFMLAGCAGIQGAVTDNTRSDLKCMAEAIYYEAGSEPLAGKHAVGHVILNRTRHSQYPNFICNVVYQRGYKNRGCQFGWTCRPHARPHGKNWAESQQVAADVLSGATVDTSRGATGFDVRRHHKHMTRTVTIGNHSFWR